MVKHFAVFTVFLTLLVAAYWLGGRRTQVLSDVKGCLSASKFSQIRAMLLAYHDKHGAFPPTRFQPDSDGPIHSWRVLLLPFTEKENLKRYEKYEFSQKWNSPRNLKALEGTDYSYFTFRDDCENANYFTIGEGEEWPVRNGSSLSGPPRLAELVTKGSDHFLVFEDLDSKIHWMEPKY